MKPSTTDNRGVAFGDFRFDAVDRLLTRDGVEVPLPPRPLALLEALLASGGRVVERRELLDEVWCDACVEDDALSQAMSVVRQALGDDPRSPRYIRTLHGRGYRFVCPVRESPREHQVEGRPTPTTGETTATAARTGPGRPQAPGHGTGDDGAAADGEPGRRILPGLAARVQRHPRAAVACAAVAGVIAGVALTAAWTHRRSADTEAGAPGVVRSEMPAPADASLSEMAPRSIAVSPDGRHVAVVAYGGDDSRLYLASRDRFGFVPIPGTEDAHGLFFSPDGDRLGYVDFRQQQIETVDLNGGAPQPACSPCDAVGGAWGTDGNLYFVGRSAGLFRVAAAGGVPEEIRPVRGADGEQAISPPTRASRGNALLFSVLREGMSSWSEAEIVSLDLDSGEETSLASRGMEPRALADGRLLFAREGRLLLAGAAPAGASRPPRVVLEGLVTAGLTGAAQYDVAADGTLVYLPGEERTVMTRVLLVDAGGSRRELELPDSLYIAARAARDGRRLALWVAGTSGHVWSFDRTRGVSTRQTFAGSNMSPVWSPDGGRIAYTAARGEGFELLLKEADAAAPPRRLLDSSFRVVAGSFSPDGRYLAFTRWQADGSTDIEWLDTVTSISTPLEAGPFAERDAAVSPDGEWLAFTSDETGRNEVYVRALAAGGARLRVSDAGGATPAFSPDGSEVFYLDANARLMRVGVRLAAEPVLGEPGVVAEGHFLPSLDVTADGVLVVEEQDGAPPTRAVRQVVGWLQDIGSSQSPAPRRRLPGS